EPRKCGYWIELVTATGDQCAAEEWIEEVLSAKGHGEGFVWLTRNRCFSCRIDCTRCNVTNILSRASREEAICDANLKLARLGDRVVVIEQNDLTEVVDAFQFPVNEVRLDHMSKPEPVAL